MSLEEQRAYAEAQALTLESPDATPRSSAGRRRGAEQEQDGGVAAAAAPPLRRPSRRRRPLLRRRMRGPTAFAATAQCSVAIPPRRQRALRRRAAEAVAEAVAAAASQGLQEGAESVVTRVTRLVQSGGKGARVAARGQGVSDDGSLRVTRAEERLQ